MKSSRRVGRFSRLVFVLAAVSGAGWAATSTIAAPWTVEIVDEEGDVGSHAALTVDALDRPVVAYRDDRFRTLRIRRKTMSGWGHVVVPPDASKNFGVWNAIVADGVGGFQVVYHEMQNYWLRHTAFDGVSWTSIEDVFIGGPYSDIVLDAQGTPHVVFIDFPGGFPSYAVRNGATWLTEFLEFPDVGAYTSLDLDGSGVPHVAYRRFGSGLPDALVLARKQPDGSWEKVDLVTDPPVDATDVSLAVDSADRVHVAYHDDTAGTLVHCLLDGPDTTFTVVDSGDVGQFASLVVDADLVPHIAYYDPVAGDLKYVRGDDWTPVVVDSTGDVGRYASLALDSGQRPHIAYYDATNGNLRHAWIPAPVAAGLAETAAGPLSVRPNPFREGVDISLTLPRSSPVDLRVYDVRGRPVRTLLRRTLPSGTHSLHWNGRPGGGGDLPAGVYFLRLGAEGVEEAARVVKIR